MGHSLPSNHEVPPLTHLTSRGILQEAVTTICNPNNLWKTSNCTALCGSARSCDCASFRISCDSFRLF
eukprot:m.284489 g.284489  ORF g.284489 m.284489 type:complete len:68 (+) comp27020_c0_seq3:577-780(+)